MRRWPRRHEALIPPPTRYAHPAGDGCTTARVLPAHGFLLSGPVNATVSLRAKSVLVELVGVDYGAKQTYTGTLDESVCGTQSLQYSGRIQLKESPQSQLSFVIRLPWSFNPPLNSDQERTRVEIEARKQPDEPDPILELWNAPDDPKNFLEPYRKALQTAVDVYSVVRIRRGSTLVAYSLVASPRLNLAELAGTPLAVERTIETGLVCETGDECTAKLACHEIGAASYVLVASLWGSSTRGQGNFRMRQGELWTLTAEGFKLGAGLPNTESSDTAHGRRASRTALYWVDGDGEAPFEILVKHSDSENEDGPGFGLLAFDTTEQTYRPVAAMPPTSREMLDKLTYINAIAEY